MKKLHTTISQYSCVLILLYSGLAITSAYAQDTCKFAQKNSLAIGGNFSIKSSSYFEKDTYTSTGTTQTINYLPEYDLSFTPSITWFPTDGLGLDFGLSFTTQNGVNNTGNYSAFQSSLVVGVGYYFNIDSSFFPYSEILGLRNIFGDDQSQLNSDIYYQYGGRAGCKIAVTNGILLDIDAQILFIHDVRREIDIKTGFSFTL